MPKKTLLATGAILFFALALVPASALATTAHPAHAASSLHISTSKVSYAFTALITTGKTLGKPITGGLTLNIDNSGNVSGSFHTPDNQVASVTGQATGSQITLLFQDVLEDHVLQGTGTVNNSGEYLGTFNLFTSGQKEVSSGVWSGLPVANPDGVLAFALRSFITQGPDKGTVFTAAVVIDKKTLTGTFSGPSGDLASVTVVFKDGGETIIASYAGGVFIDTGHLVDNPAGYVGNVVVSGSADRGHWVGSFFTF